MYSKENIDLQLDTKTSTGRPNSVQLNTPAKFSEFVSFPRTTYKHPVDVSLSPKTKPPELIMI